MTTDWSQWQPTLRATLLFVVDRDTQQVLLIRKKRGLGEGKINGPGGKLDPGETACECAVRETEEELHVTAHQPRKHGELWFQFTDGLGMHVAVFIAESFTGTPTETDEAIPLWTPLDALPLEEMWQDDRFWLKQLLHDGATFRGCFSFDGDQMLSHEIEWNADRWMDDQPA